MSRRGLFPHHERLIERAVDRFRADPDVLAVIVGGSVAHGLARADSDVDLMLLLEDDELERRAQPTFSDASLADYEDGYADVKLISRGFLADVAVRGSEPARWAFQDAFAAFSRLDDVETLLVDAAAYPEAEREQKLYDFVAHAAIAAWYLAEAEKQSDRYLASYASSRLALYAGRAVLAHNRRLFPFHKWFLHELGRVPERPDGLLELIDELLRAPHAEAGTHLVESVQDFVGIHPSLGESGAAFVRRTEWSWRSGGAPLDES